MDFRSELCAEDDKSSTKETSLESIAPDISTDLCGNDELDIVFLQNKKNALLTQREKLLMQLKSNRKESDNINITVEPRERSSLLKSTNSSPAKQIPYDSSGLLMPFTKALPESSHKKRRICKPVTKINGSSSLEDELEYKFDALPLVNNKLRLEFLKRSCPSMDIEILKEDHVKINYLSDTELVSNFFLQYDIEIDRESGRLIKLSNLTVSEHVMESLNPLLCHVSSTMNIGSLLFGCNEFSRLCVNRNEVLDKLLTEINQIAHMNILEKNEECLIIEKFIWKIEIKIIIKFKEAYPFIPCSIIMVHLYKNDNRTKSIQEIVNSLIKEYGIIEGIVQFIKSLSIMKVVTLKI